MGGAAQASKGLNVTRRLPHSTAPLAARRVTSRKRAMFLASFGSGAQSRPSFFEMVAQQDMMPRLQPALKHVLLVRHTLSPTTTVPELFQVIVQRHPELEWLISWSDEIFYAGLLWLESHFLRHYGTQLWCSISYRLDSSFAENFYGLKRIRASQAPPPVPRKQNTYMESIIQSFAAQETQLRPVDRLSGLLLLVCRFIDVALTPRGRGTLREAETRCAASSARSGAGNRRRASGS